MGFLGGFLQGIGNFMNAQADAENAEERARVAIFNSKVALQEAKSTMQVAQADASDFKVQQSARRAASRAVAAGQGFMLEGSPLMVDKAILTHIEFATDRLFGNARIKQARLRTQSALLVREAAAERANAQRARQAGIIGLFSGIAGGFSSLGGGASFF